MIATLLFLILLAVLAGFGLLVPVVGWIFTALVLLVAVALLGEIGVLDAALEARRAYGQPLVIIGIRMAVAGVLAIAGVFRVFVALVGLKTLITGDEAMEASEWMSALLITVLLFGIAWWVWPTPS